jgi:pseudaminic acid biosynthesis-associated methylase
MRLSFRMDQIETWRGDFGTAYTERNVIDWQVRLPAWRSILTGKSPKRVLEIGCNRGHNLQAISSIYSEADCIGLEPNRYALSRALENGVQAVRGVSSDLPFRDDWFDLVLTAGVLIHVPRAELPSTLSEIKRVSSRFVLVAEYYAESEAEIEYRGQTGLLWKRDYGELLTSVGLKIEQTGFLGRDTGFDDCTWWLATKS